jgi:hypothetical protein
MDIDDGRGDINKREKQKTVLFKMICQTSYQLTLYFHFIYMVGLKWTYKNCPGYFYL